MPIVLGIETSCDETAAALVRRDPGGKPHVMSNIVFSQVEEHAGFGGVVPEIAARAHLSVLDNIIELALNEAKTDLEEVHAIAATAGPGLSGGLIVGSMMAKAMAAATDKTFLAINHLEGHALTPRFTDALEYPYLLLLVSGGHTQILEVHGLGNYVRLATTIDDALGEAFDKTAKLLGLGQPGGPQVQEWAKTGDPERFRLPRPLAGRKTLDMSFSGLKTAIRNEAKKLEPLADGDVSDLCAAMQTAAGDVLADRCGRAMTTSNLTQKKLVVAGGVAANTAIRAQLEALCLKAGWDLVAPPIALCTDNAAMIAWAGLERYEAGMADNFNAPVHPRWPLDASANPVLGHGKRGVKA